MPREEVLEVEDGLEQADVPPEGVEVLAVEELEEGLEAAGLTPLHWVEACGEVVVVVSPTAATLLEVVEASSHPSCPTACTLRAEVSRVLLQGLTTFLEGILEGGHGLAGSEAARDPSTNR